MLFKQYWSISAAVILFLAGGSFALVPPGPIRKNLTELGSAIGGVWALSAGLLALFATTYGVSRQIEQRKREVAAICLAEISAIWDQLVALAVLNSLQESTNRLRETKVPVDGLCYRGNVGDAWLCLQSSNPEAFGVLQHDLAKRVSSHYSRLRNNIGRLNWMNTTKFDQTRYYEVLGRQDNVLKEMRELRSEIDQLVNDLEKIIDLGSRTAD
jgi:hypothetical protein